MGNKQLEAVNKELHSQAVKLIKEYVNDFATTLLLQAKILAYEKKDDIVLSTHVEQALDAIRRKQRQIWSKELTVIIGSALFGAFLQGFITELSTGNALLITVYTILGFVGMILVFWGISR